MCAKCTGQNNLDTDHINATAQYNTGPATDQLSETSPLQQQGLHHEAHRRREDASPQLRPARMDTSSSPTDGPSEFPKQTSSLCWRRASCASYCGPVTWKTGSGSKSFRAKWQVMYAAAAIPKIAGSMPNTGIVRIRKFGTTCSSACVS